MNRRAFITLLGGAAAWPVVASAQQAERMRRIGVVVVTKETDPETPLRAMAFRQALAKLGWSEGRNVVIDFRFGTGGERKRRAGSLPASQRQTVRGRAVRKYLRIPAIHRGERLFANFAVHQSVGRLGFCLYTHHLVVCATFRAFEISGDVLGRTSFTQYERASEPGPPRHPPASIGGRARMLGTAGV